MRRGYSKRFFMIETSKMTLSALVRACAAGSSSAKDIKLRGENIFVYP